MAAGRSAPRYERMVLLYPRSQALQSYLSEYFIVIVQICHRAFKFGQKQVLGQILSAIGDGDANLQSHKADLEKWAKLIKEEVDLLGVEEHRSHFKSLMLSSESETARRRNEARIAILEACSIYDYQTTWKQIRKRGGTSLLNKNEVYLTWKANEQSCTLVCTGKLGSGKSVLLANIVDDLNRDVQSLMCPVAYFFCRYDLAESLTSNTILRSLARQLLQPIKELSPLSHERLETMDFPNTFKVSDLLALVVSPKFHACIIIDGLDACDETESDQLLKDLQQLQDLFPIRACISFRTDAKVSQRIFHGKMKAQTLFSIPEDNPDIERFITTELDRRIESWDLAIGNPCIVIEIRDALLRGAQGMFLWVVLQIDSLCQAKTDESIRQALLDLPSDLPKTFTRILQRSSTLGCKYQTKILELLTTTRRPLTTEECREALSVVVGDTDWNPSRLLNDVYSALASCGSLITVDEEDDTVSFIHHSVVQYLLSDCRACFSDPFTARRAASTMGCVIVTYLNYSVFDIQLSKNMSTQMDSAAMPSKVIRSMNLQSSAQSIALRLLRSSEQPNFNFGEALQEVGQVSKPRRMPEFAFLQYAKSNWSYHVRFIAKEEHRCHKLVLRLSRGAAASAVIGTQDCDWISFVIWAAQSGHTDIVHAIFERFLPFKARDTNFFEISVPGAKAQKFVREILGTDAATLMVRDPSGHSLLSWLFDNLVKADERFELERSHDFPYAVKSRSAAAIRLQLSHGIDHEGTGPESQIALAIAAEHDWESILRRLAAKDADLDRKQVHVLLERPLIWAGRVQNYGVVWLLVNRGGQLNCRDSLGQTALHRAARCRDMESIADFVQFGTDIETKDNVGQSALSIAAGIGAVQATRFLISRGSNCESRDITGRTPILHAAQNGHAEVVRTLVDYGGANIESRDHNGCTALIAATKSGCEHTVYALTVRRASVEVRDSFQRSALSYAAMNGRADLIRLLLVQSVQTGNVDEYLDRALSYAVSNGQFEAAKMIIEAGTYPAKLTRSALAIAYLHGTQESLARVLTETDVYKHTRGDDPEKPDEI